MQAFRPTTARIAESGHRLSHPFSREQARAPRARPFARSGGLSGAVLLGLLGCGAAAERFHVPAIARLTNARLTAAYDPHPEQGQRIARSAPGCRPFDTPQALLEARVVDAVLIASSPESHASLAVMALGAGVPVLIEPPLAATREEAEWIRDAERVVRLPVMVGFNRRWWPPVERLRQVLAGSQEEEVRIDSAIDGGDTDPFVALSVQLDLVRHLIGREIAAISGQRDLPGEIQAAVTFHGGGNAVCRVRARARPDERITIRSGRRRYEVRSGSGRFRPATGPWRRALDLADVARMIGSRDGVARSYEDQLRGFIRSVQARIGLSPGTTDGMAVVLVIDALRRSLAEGGVETPVPATPAG